MSHLPITSQVVFHIYIIQSDWTVENSQSIPVFKVALQKEENLLWILKASAHVGSVLILVIFLVFPSVQMYMSPELVLCRGHSTKTDIYSLGTTIIHMLSGSPPWVRRYPRTAYPSYLYIVSVLCRFDHGESECLLF